MNSNRCKLLEAQDKRELVEISQLIDLTDKPIGLTRNEIGWSKVRSNASNCLCCCCNNSVTLVTTDNSYILNHVPIDNIQYAQANSTLQYLALSNHRKLVIIDLVDHNENSTINDTTQQTKATKIVNLASHGLTMNDIVFWRWIDEDILAILSYEALYTCNINQQQLTHPAFSALSIIQKNISMEKVFDCHPHLTSLCQVTEIQRNSTANMFAITGLYSTNNLLRFNAHSKSQKAYHSTQVTHNLSQILKPTLKPSLKPSFGSVPSRLSHLAHSDQNSFDSLKFDSLFEQSNHLSNVSDEVISGLVQIHCKVRGRSQLIQAHAVAFTSISSPSTLQNTHQSSQASYLKKSNGTVKDSTILVAANKTGNLMRVYFIEMAAGDYLPTTSLNLSPTIKLDHLTAADFPSSIVCSHVEPSSGSHLHIALITTKYGQLFVCSVTHSSILFNIPITTDIISSTVLESNTKGLMVICRNGQVLLIKLNLRKLMRLLNESRRLRHISSTPNFFSSLRSVKSFREDLNQPNAQPKFTIGDTCNSHEEICSKVLLSTRL